MDGLDYLIDQKIADPDRLGVGGESYGGYMTARTVTQTNRFKAAFVGFGMTNLFTWAGTASLSPSEMRAYFLDLPSNQRANYDKHSAMTFVKNCQTPTLIEHGDWMRSYRSNKGGSFTTVCACWGRPLNS